MLRWLATAVIGLLLFVVLWLPSTGIGRRSSEAAVRSEAAGALPTVGAAMPDFELLTLDDERFRLADLRGHRVLVTFERSVDW